MVDHDDIIDFSSEDSRTGYLATSPEEYANAIEDALRTLELNEQLEDSHIEVGVKYNRHDFKSDNIIAGIEDDNGTSFQRSSSLLCSIRSKLEKGLEIALKNFLMRFSHRKLCLPSQGTVHNFYYYYYYY